MLKYTSCMFFLCLFSCPQNLFAIYYSSGAAGSNGGDPAVLCHRLFRVFLMATPFLFTNAMMLAMLAQIDLGTVWFCGGTFAASTIFVLNQTAPYIHVCF